MRGRSNRGEATGLGTVRTLAVVKDACAPEAEDSHASADLGDGAGTAGQAEHLRLSDAADVPVDVVVSSP